MRPILIISACVCGLLDAPPKSVSAVLDSAAAEQLLSSRQMTAVAQESSAASSWPTVDSMVVSRPFASATTDTVLLKAYVTNPSSTTFNGATLSVTARELLGGHIEQLAMQTLNLPAGQQTVRTITWIPRPALTGLEHQLSAELSLPFPLQADAACVNRVQNGTFDGGLSGWTVVNNNPPAWGVTVSFGELKVYSTIYNTEGWTAAAYQDVSVIGVDFDQTRVRFRARYYTQDGFGGYGLALTYVAFLDQSGTQLGFVMQWASTVSTPPDTPTQHYGRAQTGAALGYDKSINAILDAVPEVDRSRVAFIRIGAEARPYCYTYCTTRAETYIDDVEVTDCPGNVARGNFNVVVTPADLTAEVIGDRKAIIRACFQQDPCREFDFADLVPLAGTVRVWDRVNGYLCTAGVHQETGDRIKVAFAALMATRAVWDEMAAAAWVLNGEGPGALGVVGLVLDASGGVRRWLAECESTAPLAESSTANDLASGAAAVLAGQGEGIRHYGIVAGPVRPSIRAGGAVTTSEGLLHTGAAVVPLDDPGRLFLAALDDTILALPGGSIITRSDSAEVKIDCIDSGTVDLSVVFSSTSGDMRVLSYDTLLVEAGARIRYAYAEGGGDFAVYVDRNGDGLDDAVRFPVSVVAVDKNPGSIRVGTGLALSVAPNPASATLGIDAVFESAGTASVEVFDLVGRRVRTLFRGQVSAGPRRWSWDCIDRGGQRVAAGQYLLCVRSGGAVATRKVTIAR